MIPNRNHRLLVLLKVIFFFFQLSWKNFSSNGIDVKPNKYFQRNRRLSLLDQTNANNILSLSSPEVIIPQIALDKFHDNNLAIGTWTGHCFTKVISPVNSLYADWGNFTFALENRTIANNPTAVYAFDLSESANKMYKCSDPEITTTIWTALSVRTEIDIKCGGVYWRSSNLCFGTDITMCANCTDPCRGAFNTLLGFTTTARKVTYPLWTQASTATSFNVTVDFNLHSFGIITCAAIPPRQPVLSVLAIANAANFASKRVADAANLTGTLKITRLLPNTNYNIFCYTTALDPSLFDDSVSSLGYSFMNRNLVATTDAAIPVLQLTIPSSNIVKNAFPTQILVSLPYKPSANLTVIPTVSFYGDDLCSPGMAFNGSASGAFISTPNAAVTPEILSFTDELVLQQSFYLQTYATGCYSLIFTVIPGQSNGVFVAQQASFVWKNKKGASSVEFFVNSTLVPVEPTIAVNSLQFTNTGLLIMLTFSSETDEGGNFKYRQNFRCTEMLSFKGAERSMCRFSSASSIRIYPPTSGSDLLMPKDTVTILPNKIKGKCLFNVSNSCAHLPFLSFPPIPITVSGSINVNPVITSPIMIATGSNLTVDISLSSGNGGRRWDEVHWQVLYNGKESGDSSEANSLEQFLNSGKLKWSGCAIGTITCDTIPFFYFFQAGEYTLRLTLVNFLGMSGYTSTIIQVKNQPYIPYVRLFAPVFSTTWYNHSLTVRSSIDLGGYQCPKPISIAWLVFRGSLIDKSLVVDSKLYKDTRTYVAVTNSLKPYEEYRFRIVVFCGNSYSMDEIVKYVIPPIIVPTFTAGSSVAMPLNAPVVFDVANSYKNTPTAFYGLTFHWSCVQLSPLNVDGCGTFLALYQDHNETAASITVSNPDLVFNYSSVYVISVTAISLAGRTAFTANQQFTTTLNANTPTVHAFPVNQFTVNNTYGYQIDAFVTGPLTYTAVWKIATTNVTLATKTFPNGGMENFPINIPSLLLSSRLSYAFSLSAFIPTESCQLLGCMDPRLVSSSTFSISVNQPPSNGYVDTFPSSGNEKTVFSVFAYNWQDDNLPLFYAFFQSYFQNRGFNMIRNRMQINYMTGSLSAPVPGSNNTVFVQGEISDYYGATATASKIVTVEAHVINATQILAETKRAITTVFYERNPEILLPVACEIVDAMHALNCTRMNSTKYCDELIIAGSYALERSLDFYNTGSALFYGLSRYTNSFSTANQVTVYSAFRSLLSLYQYLNNGISEIGLTRFTSVQLVQSMVETANEMVKMYKGVENDFLLDYQSLTSITVTTKTGNHSENILVWLQDSVNTLSLNFFNILPFGIKQRFITDQHFNTTMTRSYWYETVIMTPDYTLIEDVVFNKKLFPANQTSSYSYLNTISILPPVRQYQNSSLMYASANGFEKYETKFLMMSTNTVLDKNHPLNFTLTLKAFNITNPQFLRLLAAYEGHPYNGMSSATTTTTVITTAPVKKYLYCNDTQSIASHQPVVCSAEETNGDSYEFPVYDCQGNTSLVVEFHCPFYGYELVCTNYTVPMTLGSLVLHNSQLSETTISCSFPVTTGEQVAVSRKVSSSLSTNNDPSNGGSSSSGISISGSFSFAVDTKELTSAKTMRLMNPIDQLSDPTVRKVVSIVAVVSLLLSAAVFGAFLVYRVKHFTETTVPGNSNRYFPFPSARLVRRPRGITARTILEGTTATGTDTNSESLTNLSVDQDGNLSEQEISSLGDVISISSRGNSSENLITNRPEGGLEMTTASDIEQGGKQSTTPKNRRHSRNNNNNNSNNSSSVAPPTLFHAAEGEMMEYTSTKALLNL
jgi:hypothetical protein